MIEDRYIVEIRRRGGVRSAKRYPLRIPVDAARGQFERLSTRALNDLITDLHTEQLRRFTG